MKLVVGDAGDGLAGDHAIWGDARLSTPRAAPSGPGAGLKAAKRVAQNFATKPLSDGTLKSMLNTSVQGRGEVLAFGLKVPNGTYDAWIWVSENSGAGAHLFDLDLQGVALKGLGALPSRRVEQVRSAARQRRERGARDHRQGRQGRADAQRPGAVRDRPVRRAATARSPATGKPASHQRHGMPAHSSPA